MFYCYDEYIYAKVSLIISFIMFLPIILNCIGGVIYTAVEWIIKHWRNHR